MNSRFPAASIAIDKYMNRAPGLRACTSFDKRNELPIIRNRPSLLSGRADNHGSMTPPVFRFGIHHSFPSTFQRTISNPWVNDSLASSILCSQVKPSYRTEGVEKSPMSQASPSTTMTVKRSLSTTSPPDRLSQSARTTPKWQPPLLLNEEHAAYSMP